MNLTQLTFDSVSKVREALCRSFAAHGDSDFYLDLTHVTHFDSAGLALLIEAKKLCVQHSKTLHMIGMSSKFHDLATFCGVNDILAD